MRLEWQGGRRRVRVPSHDLRKSPKIKHRRQEEVTVIQKTFPGPSRLTSGPHPSGRPPGHPRHQLRHRRRNRPRLPEAEMPPKSSCVSRFLFPCPQTSAIRLPLKSPQGSPLQICSRFLLCFCPFGRFFSVFGSL